MRWQGMCLVALGCMLFTGASLSVRAQDFIDSWTVDYTTKAVTVESVVESVEGYGPVITFKLKNTSGRPITAIAVEAANITGSTFSSPEPLQPGNTKEFKFRPQPGADFNRRLTVKAVLFADKGADEGDPSTVQVLRFTRLSGLLEQNRCLAMVNRLDPSRLDTASITAHLASVNAAPNSLDEALASLPEDPNLKFASHARIRGASADAQKAFFYGVRYWRHMCSTRVQRRTEEGARGIGLLRRDLQREIETMRPLCERDMAMEAAQ